MGDGDHCHFDTAGSSGAEAVMIFGKWKVFHACGGLAGLSARVFHYMLHLVVFFVSSVFFESGLSCSAHVFVSFSFFFLKVMLVILKCVIFPSPPPCVDSKVHIKKNDMENKMKNPGNKVFHITM